MKLRSILYSAAVLILAFARQPKEDPKPEITIPAESKTVFTQGIKFQEDPGEQPKTKTTTVTFVTNEKWTADVTEITKASSWLSVEPTSGNAGSVTMTVTAQPNTTSSERSATVTITCGTDTESFTVTQAAAPPTVIPLTSVTLNKTELELTTGTSETLVATVAPDNATDKTVVWSSSDDKVASVDQTGKVTAVAAGEATITAKAGDKEATCKVTVKDNFIAVTEVTVNVKELPMTVGEYFTLGATVKPDDATDPTVTWSSSDESVATVTEIGTVHAVGAGQATITAKAGDKEATCTVTVSEKVIPVTEITINVKELPMTVGEYFTLGATVKPDDATDPTVTWSSSDESVATVTEIGTVHAVGAGQATITAKAGDKEATCTVTVSEKVIPVTEITINVKELPMTVGEYFTLGATVKPDDATDPTVIWSSSDESVATVTEIGTVHAVAAGKATITAKAGDKEATCKVTVTEPVIEVESIELDASEVTLETGNSMTLTATVNPDDATDPTVTWSSSDENVAAVDANGKVTAVGAGEATITATAGDKEATCKVTVEEYIFKLSPSTVAIAEKGGEISIEVQSTLPFELSSMPQWISLKEKDGNVFRFSVAPNKETVQRSGDVTFTDERENCISCTVTQEKHEPEHTEGGNEDVEDGEDINW